MPADQPDGWAIIAQLINNPTGTKPKQRRPRSAQAGPGRGWPKGKPRGKRDNPTAVEEEVEMKPVEQIADTLAIPEKEVVDANADDEKAEEPPRKKRRSTNQSRNIIMAASGLYRPGWYPVKGAPLQRGKGFSSLEEAIKNRDILETFIDQFLPKYTELTDKLSEVFMRSVDICGWRTDITVEQLNAEVWQFVKELATKKDLKEFPRYQRRQKVKKPQSNSMVTMNTLSKQKPGVSMSFIEGLLGPKWRAPATVAEDVYKVARAFDKCFEQILSLGRLGRRGVSNKRGAGKSEQADPSTSEYSS